jgi:hypothetical protein
MPISVNELVEKGVEKFAGGFGGANTCSPTVLQALSAKKAYTAEEIAEKTGLTLKQVKNVVGRNARKGKIGRRFYENKAYYHLLEGTA